MNYKKKWLSTAMIAVLGLTLLVGCGGQNAAEKSSEKEASSAKKVVLALDYTPNTNHTGFYVALDKGFYKDAGLDVHIQPPPDGGATPLVGSGKAQFGVDFQDLLAAGFVSEHPVPVTAVAALIQHNTSGLMTLQSSGITRPKELAGKTYGTWNNPIELAMVKDVIKKDGGDPNTLKTIPNNATDVFAALKTDMDAVWIYYAWDGMAAKIKGEKTNYMSFRKLNPVFDYYTPVLIANNDFLKKHPDEAKAFLAATAKGYQYAIDHPEEAANILLAHADGLDKNLVMASQKWLAGEYVADAPRWGYIDPARWNAFYKWLNDEKLVEKPLAENTGFSNDYLPEK